MSVLRKPKVEDLNLIPLMNLFVTMIPLLLLTAYARGSAFRVAHADSLNRMLIEVVPVAVLFVAAIALSRLSAVVPDPSRAPQTKHAHH